MYNHFYVIKIQYLGYRYHGWQKQLNFKTVHLMIDKTLNYIFDDKVNFKTLGASRTDAMVSANESAFELFLEKDAIKDFSEFLRMFNYYLPQDIRALSINTVDETFNIIQSPRLKEYYYLFSFGHKSHPFSASIMTTFRDNLDINQMIQAAQLFEGTHNFKSFCSNTTDEKQYVRTILSSQIIENTIYKASFFPESSYIFKVHASGFGQNQIRLMMGALVQIGKHEVDFETIKKSLKLESSEIFNYIAPASGLILNSIEFQ